MKSRTTNQYRKRRYGVVPQESQTGLGMTQGKYAAMRRLPSESPVNPVLGQHEYSRGTLANRVSKVNKSPKNVDLWARTNVVNGPNEPFWDPVNNQLLQISNYGTICNLSTLVPIPQGVGETQREGRQALITSITIRGVIIGFLNTGLTNVDTTYYQEQQDIQPLNVRIWLLLDKQANGEAPQLGDLVTSPATGVPATTAGSDNINVLQNLNNIQRFIVLQDRTYNVSPTGYDLTTKRPIQMEKPFTITHKCEIPIEYASVQGNINEIRGNNILLYAWCDAPGAGVTTAGSANLNYSQCLITCNTRCTFLG